MASTEAGPDPKKLLVDGLIDKITDVIDNFPASSGNQRADIAQEIAERLIDYATDERD